MSLTRSTSIVSLSADCIAIPATWAGGQITSSPASLPDHLVGAKKGFVSCGGEENRGAAHSCDAERSMVADVKDLSAGVDNLASHKQMVRI
jgi:hypothetical protein